MGKVYIVAWKDAGEVHVNWFTNKRQATRMYKDLLDLQAFRGSGRYGKVTKVVFKTIEL